MLRNRCEAKPYQVSRWVCVTFLAIPPADDCGLPTWGPFFFEIASIMAEIGGFQAEDLFYSILFFAFFVLSLTLSVAVCRPIQQVLSVRRSLKKVAEHWFRSSTLHDHPPPHVLQSMVLLVSQIMTSHRTDGSCSLREWWHHNDLQNVQKLVWSKFNCEKVAESCPNHGMVLCGNRRARWCTFSCYFTLANILWLSLAHHNVHLWTPASQ